MTHQFEIELEAILPASPQEVWEAIATGPGIDSWFMGRNEVDPREGGVAAMDTGGRREEALITAYDVGKRFATRMPAAEANRTSASMANVATRCLALAAPASRLPTSCTSREPSAISQRADN